MFHVMNLNIWSSWALAYFLKHRNQFYTYPDKPLDSFESLHQQMRSRKLYYKGTKKVGNQEIRDQVSCFFTMKF